MANEKISEMANAGPLVGSDKFPIARVGSQSNLYVDANAIAAFATNAVALAISAGTSQQQTGTIAFGDSNGLSFGLSDGTLTGSYTVPVVPAQTVQPGIQSISAGTTVATTGQVILSNSNNVSFGLNGDTLTASASFAAETPFGVSAGTQSVSTGTLVFSNSNNVTFGMSGSSRVTASASFPAQTVQPMSLTGTGNTASNSTLTGNALFVSGGPNITVGMTNNTLVISGGAGAVGNTGFISAGANTASLGTVVFSNSNNVTFGANGQTVTASASFAAETPFGLSAGTQSVSTGTLVFSNSNNVTFGMSGSSRVTASASFPAETPFGVSAGTQSVSTGTLVFSNSNNVTFGMSGSSRVTASASFPAETPFGVSAGTQSVSTGTLVFSNSNNVSFGMSGSSQVTASASFPAETPFGISAGTQSVSTGTMVFSNSNGISFGMSGSSRVTASYTVPPSFSAGVSTDGNTAGATGVTGSRLVLVGSNGMTLSQTTDANGGTVSILCPQFTQSARWILPPLFASGAIRNGTLQFAPFEVDQFVTATRAEMMLTVSLSTSSNSSHAGTLSFHIGIYTRTGSTLSLGTSGSTSAAWTNTSDNSANSISGLRRMIATMNISMTPGDYFYGVIARSSTGNTNWFTASWQIAAVGLMGGPAAAGFGVVTNSSYQPVIGLGQYSVTTAALPSSLALSEIGNQSNPATPAIMIANYTV
jgi:hypothetical protein